MPQHGHDPRLLPRLPSTPPPRLITPEQEQQRLLSEREQKREGILGAQPSAPATDGGRSGNLLDRLFGSDNASLSEGQRDAGRKAGLLALGTSLLKSSAPRTKGTGSLGSNIGEAIEAARASADVGIQRHNVQQMQQQQQAAAQRRQNVMSKYVGQDTSNPAVLQNMFGDMLIDGDYKGAAQVAEVLKSQGGKLMAVQAGDRTVLVNPFTGKEVATIEKGPDSELNFNQANTMWGRFSRETVQHSATALNFRKLLASANDPSPAGDVSMIFAFMKMIDPGSVVRESEFATAANTGSIPVRVWSLYNRIVTGERLTTGQRADFAKQAQNLAEETHTDLLKRIDSFVARGQRLAPNLDPQDFTFDYFTGIDLGAGAGEGTARRRRVVR